jgi:hypothetical protein
VTDFSDSFNKQGKEEEEDVPPVQKKFPQFKLK